LVAIQSTTTKLDMLGMITIGSTVIVSCCGSGGAVPHRFVVAVCDFMGIGDVAAAGGCANALVICTDTTRSDIGTHSCGDC